MSHNDKAATIQQKIDQLHEAVAWFQGDEFTLEQAVEHFERAEQLADIIEAELGALKNDITVIKQRFDT